MYFIVLDAEIRGFLICDSKKEEVAWKLTPNVADIESCEGNIYKEYTSEMEAINSRQATLAGFHLCTGKERSLLALYLRNSKKSKTWLSAPCNTQSIKDKIEAVLEGWYYIRNFDGYSFECVHTDKYATSPIICIDLKAISIASKKSELHYRNPSV